MKPFSLKRTCFCGYLITVSLTFLTALAFSIVFTRVPLRMDILPVFANLTLGLAVFSGAFFIARQTPFFRLRHIFVLSAAVLSTVLLCTFLFGEISTEILIQKTVLIGAASLLGEICGRM